MKKLYVVACCLICAISSAQNEMVSPVKNVNIPSAFNVYAKDYVEKRVNEWQKKGEFEKTADWQKRVNMQTRQRKIEELTLEARNKYIGQHNLDISLYNEYDADNESFLLTDATFGKLIVPVPINEAPMFKKGFANAKFTPSYFIEEGLCLASLDIEIDGKTYSYSNKESFTYNEIMPDYKFDPIDIKYKGDENNGQGHQNIGQNSIAIGKSDVDLDIPQTSIVNNNAYVVIIANELYDSESKVDFAVNDGLIFYDYCVKTLGIPENHIKFAKNATYNQMRSSIGWLATGVNNKEGEGSAIFYYAGHGIPDKETETAYLLPVDGEASYAQSGIALKDLYLQLGTINSKNNLVLLDACFSGTQREGGMLPSLAKARGVAIKVKSNAPQGNTIVLSAASGEQTALPYAKMGHGMFTYYLLKKLQSSKGNVTIGELSDYITKNVKTSAFDECNGKTQTPTVSVSPAMENVWRDLTLK